MIVVTGNAPRSGTSAMMRALLTHYKPHSYIEEFPEYVAKGQNPNGYWDVKKEHLWKDTIIPTETGAVIKLWAPMFHRINPNDVDLLVFMERKNFAEQVDSIARTAVAEGFTVDHEEIANMFKNQHDRTRETFINNKQICVDMENFRENPDLYVNLIKEVVPCQ